MTQNSKVVQDTRWGFQTFSRRWKFIQAFLSIIKLFAKNRNAKNLFSFESQLKKFQCWCKNTTEVELDDVGGNFKFSSFSSPTEAIIYGWIRIKNTRHRRRNNIAVIFLGFSCLEFVCTVSLVFIQKKNMFFLYFDLIKHPQPKQCSCRVV